MKKEWMEPVVEVQEFAANEYVAACGDSGKVYKFVCDAGQYGHNYNVYYYDGSGQKKYIAKKGSWGDWGSQAQFSGYHPCNKTHEAESDSGFMGMILTINTNGTLLGESWADFFAEYRPRRINITLYGADAASYNRLCHYPQGFDQTVRAIRLLRERNVDVKISCSVTKKNAHDFPKIFVLGEKLGVPVHADHYMMPAVRERSLPFDAQVRLNPEDAAALALQTLKLQLTSDIFRQYVHESIHRVNNPSFPRGNGHISCLAGNCSFFINWQGFLFPCVMLSEISAPVFDLGFISAWEKVSAAAQKISLSSQCCQCRLQPICRTCVAAAFLETSSYRGMPGYLCRYSEHYYHLLLAEEASFSSIAL